MKLLMGSELVGYIQERQVHSVRSLKQSLGVLPKLAIIRTNPDPVVDSYMRIKQSYGDEIGVEVVVYDIAQSECMSTIAQLKDDSSVHGIIVQIPLPDKSQTDEILNSVPANKDVDGLAEQTEFDAPTPMAINWLLAGYNVEPRGKHVVIVGHGRLVGKPLVKIWNSSGYDIEVVDKETQDLVSAVQSADILVSATGVAGLIKPEMLKDDVVIVDAGVATDKNGLVGDVDPAVREMPNIKITPEKGGVGPLTVAALFENVIISARKSALTQAN